MSVTQPIREYIEKKVDKFTKINDAEDFKVEVEISYSRNPSNPNQNHVEITGYFRDNILRVEETSDDMYAAIDLATDRFERQMRKYKTRMLARRRSQEAIFKSAPGAVEEVIEIEEDPVHGEVVRTKILESRPMTEDEAILQMEMLGHDFFMFVERGTGEKAVIYKRAAGDYGLLRIDETTV